MQNPPPIAQSLGERPSADWAAITASAAAVAAVAMRPRLISLLLLPLASAGLLLPPAATRLPSTWNGRRQLRAAPAVAKLDVMPSVANAFRDKPEQAQLVEKVVLAAKKELGSNPKAKTELGKPIRLDVVAGAGVRPNGDVMVRFFLIFSKSGKYGSSFSCNVSATGRVDGNAVSLKKLSCAKDEGWGRTVDII